MSLAAISALAHRCGLKWAQAGVLALWLVSGFWSVAPVAAGEADPLHSARWLDMRQQLFRGQPVVFDPQVVVNAPDVAEDPLNVPVRVDATALQQQQTVREVRVFADFNPITQVLSFQPHQARAALGFRVKLQQSTPVRAAVLTADGVWHVGGRWITTSGGGCTVPATQESADWQRHLNQVSGKLWPGRSVLAQLEEDAEPADTRLRFRIEHPMDTGLAAGVPAFFIQQLQLKDSSQQLLMSLELSEPIAQNPVFTALLPGRAGAVSVVWIEGRDNNGNRIQGKVQP